MTMARVGLGTTGIEISEFCFGAGSIGGIGSSAATRGKGLTAEEGAARLDEAIELGVRVVDTADAYAGGDSERAVGAWLAAGEGRPEVLVETKVGNIGRPPQEGADLSAGHIARQLRQSIERLGRVDLYLSHAPDPTTPLEESLTAFAEARAEGLIRAYGCCNVDAAALEALLAAADRLGLPRPGWVQNRFSLVARDDEAALLPLVAAEGLGYTPFSPLAGGVLSDRYLGGARPEPGSHLDVAGPMYAAFTTPAVLDRVARLTELAREREVSTSGLALAWLRWHPLVTAPIVAPSRPAQWAAVREALALPLDAALRDEIDAIFA